MNSLKKNFILVLFAILIGNTASFAQTQNEPDSQVLKAFEALDKISNYDNYTVLDSLTTEQIEQGLQVCRKFLRRNSDSLTVSIFLYHKGRLEFVKKQYEEAKTDLEKALENDASNYPALERLCVLTSEHLKAYSKRRSFINSSLYVWTKKCNIDSSNSFNWYYLAMTYNLNMKYTNVNTTASILHCLDKCIQLDSNIAIYYYDYAQFTNKDKKQWYLLKALQKEENWYYRAQIIDWYTENKMDDPLLEFVNNSINLYESKFPNYYFFLSDLYKSKGEIHKRQNNLALYNMCLDRAKYYQSLNY